jgi:gamma-glutamyltranspeptidase/glutathione hydrolase
MVSRSVWQIAKTEVDSDEGIVATMYPQATEAGAAVLARGGNAIDAAIAAGFAIGVVEPFNSGLGGIAVLVYYDAKSGTTHVIDGTGTLPGASRPDQFQLAKTGGRTGIYGWPEVVDDANNTGPMSVAVPGTPAVLCEALERFGSMDLADIVAPAARLAEEGYAVDWYVTLGIAVNQHRLQKFPGSRAAFLMADGTVYKSPMLGVEGDVLVQRDLGRSLRLIGQHGADAFYRGEIAEMIVADIAAAGGILALEDLRNYRTRYSAGGLAGRYRGYEVIGGLENTGYPTVMEALNILEAFDLRAMGAGSLDELHLLAEAQRLAFIDRFSHLADAESVPVPVTGLLSKGFAETRAAAIGMGRADPEARAADPWPFEPSVRPHGLPPGVTGEGQTTHLTVIDKNRNMVSLLSTLGAHFGSAVVPRGTGIVINNGTMWFDPVPGTVNSVAPNRRLMTAGAPTVLLREGKPFLTIGAPGGRRVISSVIHSIVNIVDHGMGPQQALNTPRVHSEGPTTVADARIPPEILDGLRARGHRLSVKEETFSTSYFGRPNAIMVDPATGRLRGGVNQYKPTLAIGL